MEERVRRAAAERGEMDALLGEYLPFIKKQAAQVGHGLDHDDAQSLAMLTFVNAVRQYDGGRGAFLPFAATCIKNRLTDELRRERRRTEQVVELSDWNEPAVPHGYDRELEREALAEELGRFSAALERHGLTFRMLADCCPVQRRARSLCRRLAALMAEQEPLRSEFARTGRLPQGELAAQGGVSVKTVEKHRRYIVALVVLLTGDYQDIKAFLPKGVDG